MQCLESAGVAIVLVDAHNPALTAFSRVIVDDVAGGKAATQHLIDLGHRRIGYVGDEPYQGFNYTSSPDRGRGYRQALEEAGIGFRPEYFRLGKHGRRSRRRSASRHFFITHFRQLHPLE